MMTLAPQQSVLMGQLARRNFSFLNTSYSQLMQDLESQGGNPELPTLTGFMRDSLLDK